MGPAHDAITVQSQTSNERLEVGLTTEYYAQKLEEIKSLHERGLLTGAVYNRKQAEIIDCMLNLSDAAGAASQEQDVPKMETKCSVGLCDLTPLASTARCQYDGSGPFFSCWIELAPSDNLLIIRETSVSAILRTLSMCGGSVGPPKSERKGEPHVFRFDLPRSESEAEQKFVFSLSTAYELAAWTDRLSGCCAAKPKNINPTDVLTKCRTESHISSLQIDDFDDQSTPREDFSPRAMILRLKEQQLTALQEEQYEECARLRDQIFSLEQQVAQRYDVHQSRNTESDRLDCVARIPDLASWSDLGGDSRTVLSPTSCQFDIYESIYGRAPQEQRVSTKHDQYLTGSRDSRRSTARTIRSRDNRKGTDRQDSSLLPRDSVTTSVEDTRETVKSSLFAADAAATASLEKHILAWPVGEASSRSMKLREKQHLGRLAAALVRLQLALQGRAHHCAGDAAALFRGFETRPGSAQLRMHAFVALIRTVSAISESDIMPQELSLLFRILARRSTPRDFAANDSEIHSREQMISVSVVDLAALTWAPSALAWTAAETIVLKLYASTKTKTTASSPLVAAKKAKERQLSRGGSRGGHAGGGRTTRGRQQTKVRGRG
eukprot:SAG31_NODE_935_length_10892_cov_7.109886_6_plen_608_part_00